MQVPREVESPKEQLSHPRPSATNVYTPDFSIPGGRTGLTLAEYRKEILNHDPRVVDCTRRIRWYMWSTTIFSGLSGFYLAKSA